MWLGISQQPLHVHEQVGELITCFVAIAVNPSQRNVSQQGTLVPQQMAYFPDPIAPGGESHYVANKIGGFVHGHPVILQIVNKEGV